MRRLDTCSLAIIHLFTCKDCKAVLAKHFAQESTSKAGSVRSPRKARTSQENGKLGGRPKKHNDETKAKMREAWKRRKAREKKDGPSMVLSVRKEPTEPTLEERQAAAIAKLQQGKD